MPTKMNIKGVEKWFWPALDKYLNKNNLKQTQQRRKLIDQFLKLNTHIDAEMLHRKAKEIGLNVGLATVYRTLNLLEQAGLVEEHHFRDGRTLYELIPPNEHHDHLVCVRCGKVVEFENKGIEQLQDKVAKEHNFELTAHRLDLYGLCPVCRAK